MARNLHTKRSTDLSLTNQWTLCLLTVTSLLLILSSAAALISVIVNPNAILISGFCISIVLWITSILIALYPQLFDLRSFRLPGIFVASYTLLILIPGPFIYSDYPLRSRDIFLFAICIGYLCTLVGIIGTHLCFPCSQKEIQAWLHKPIHSISILYLVAWILLLICLGVTFAYIKQIGKLPILQAITGNLLSTESATQAREEALKLIPGRIRYLYVTTRNMLFPYTTLLLLATATISRHWLYRSLFLISFMANLLLAAATLEKSPVAALLIMLILALLILHRKTPSFGVLIGLAIAGLIFPVFVVIATYQFDIESTRIATAILNRIFYLPSAVLLHYFDYFPKQHPFLMGRSLPYVSNLFQDGPFPIVTTICQYFRPGSLESCSANAAYIGNFWADFSWGGVILGGILCGIVLQGVQTLILRLPKSAPSIVLQAMWSFQVIMLTSISLPDLIESTGAGYAVILTVILVVCNQFIVDLQDATHHYKFSDYVRTR